MKTIAKTVALIALLVAAGAVVDRVWGPFVSFSAQRWEPEQRGAQLIGVAEGHIKSADAASHTLRIASGFLGLGSLALDITADTIIAIHGKLGGLGDLDRGQLVRVAYEVASDRLVAARVELLNAGSPTAFTPIPTPDLRQNTPPKRPEPIDAAAKAGAIEPAVAPPVVLPVSPAEPAAAVAPAASIQPTLGSTGDDGRRSPSATERTTATRARSAELPPRSEVRALPPAPPLPPVSPPPAPAPASVPRSAAPAALPARRPFAAKPPAPPRSGDAALPRRDPDDAGAVIDWLLNSPPSSRSPQIADAP